MRQQYTSMLMTIMHNSEIVRESLDPTMTMGMGRGAKPQPAVEPVQTPQRRPVVGTRGLVSTLIQRLVTVSWIK
jgi:hypothetical protein